MKNLHDVTITQICDVLISWENAVGCLSLSLADILTTFKILFNMTDIVFVSYIG